MPFCTSRDGVQVDRIRIDRRPNTNAGRIRIDHSIRRIEGVQRQLMLTSKHHELDFLDFDKKYQKIFVMVPL